MSQRPRHKAIHIVPMRPETDLPIGDILRDLAALAAVCLFVAGASLFASVFVP